MATKWPTLSLKKKPSPEPTAQEAAPAPSPSATESHPEPATQETIPPETSAPSATESQPEPHPEPQAGKPSKKAIRRAWYPRLREGDLKHVAPVLAQDLPLMIGAKVALAHRLQEHGEIGLKEAKVISAIVLQHHVRRAAYLQACLEHSVRYDLDGNPKEPLLERGKEYAKQQLEKLQQAKTKNT